MAKDFSEEKRSKTLTILIILLILFGGFLLYRAWSGEKQTSEKEKTVTSLWLRHTDEAHGFSFEFPPSVEVPSPKQSPDGNRFWFEVVGSDGFYQEIHLFSENCDSSCFQDQVMNWWPKTKLDVKETTINGYDAVEIYFQDMGAADIRKEVYIRGDNNVVVYFVFDNLSSMDDPIDPDKLRMLESIQFK